MPQMQWNRQRRSGGPYESGSRLAGIALFEAAGVVARAMVPILPIEAPRCPACVACMVLVRSEPWRSNFELRKFECERCGQIRTLEAELGETRHSLERPFYCVELQPPT